MEFLAPDCWSLALVWLVLVYCSHLGNEQAGGRFLYIPFCYFAFQINKICIFKKFIEIGINILTFNSVANTALTKLLLGQVRISKEKLSSFIPSFVFFLSLYRVEFPTYIIFLLSKELHLTFPAKQVNWQQIFPISLRKFSFLFLRLQNSRLVVSSSQRSNVSLFLFCMVSKRYQM